MFQRFLKDLARDGTAIFLLMLMGVVMWMGFCAPQPEPALSATRAPTFEEIIVAIEQQRADSIVALSMRYQIDLPLATLIHDIALAEGIDPDLGARLIAVESAFEPQAVSRVGAIGYTQVMPATALGIMPDLAYSYIFDPATNLHLGFRYLAQLLETYDLEHALLAYNRGPTRVDRLLSMGADPRNGYATAVCGGPCVVN